MDASADWMGGWVDYRSDPVAVEKRMVPFTCLESNLNPSAVKVFARRLIHLFYVCKRLGINHAPQHLLR
jgi:hypothetical protein